MSTFVVYEPALYSWLGKLREKKKSEYDRWTGL